MHVAIDEELCARLFPPEHGDITELMRNSKELYSVLEHENRPDDDVILDQEILDLLHQLLFSLFKMRLPDIVMPESNLPIYKCFIFACVKERHKFCSTSTMSEDCSKVIFLARGVVLFEMHKNIPANDE